MTKDFLSSFEENVRFGSYAELVHELYIPSIIDSFGRLRVVDKIDTLIENHIRNHLAFDLENDNSILRPYLEKKLLKLTKENTLLISLEETMRTDIEFFLSEFGDFVIECKKLSSADQRYIHDGLARFSGEFYSKKDEEAGMIGFIYGGAIDNIVTNLKPKVKAHQPGADIDALLKEICCGYKHSFHSRHTRITQPEIFIHHLFVDLT